MPHLYKTLKSPLPPSSVSLQEASGHYLEHCAVCHGNNGKGEAKFKGIMYPRSPSLLSKDTREESDGELYWIIKNGVRWSGMPAFGKPGVMMNMPGRSSLSCATWPTLRQRKSIRWSNLANRTITPNTMTAVMETEVQHV